MARPVKTFDLNNESQISQGPKERKPLVQLEPSCFYEDELDLSNHSSIPQGVELKRKDKEIENNVELSDFERKLQKVGIIPSDSWIQGPSKNLWVNLAHNFFTETFGILPEQEVEESGYIIDLPQDNLAKVDNLEPSYTPSHSTRGVDTTSATVDINYDLFYSEDDESNLDEAPSVCEIFK